MLGYDRKKKHAFVLYISLLAFNVPHFKIKIQLMCFMKKMLYNYNIYCYVSVVLLSCLSPVNVG